MTHPEWLPSPIKVNLFLHITGRQPDGNHLLQTLFQFLDYGDEIRFEPLDNGLIERIDHHDFVLPDSDLCIEAAKQLRQHANNPTLGIRIHLRKIIPPGTGLGAGSSNAATVLLALNRLWQVDLPEQALLDIGRELGADVPVFIHGKATWAEGVGDQFTPCSPPTGWVSVVLPNVSVSTADAFASPLVFREHAPVDFDDFLGGRTGNDLEQAVCQTHPLVTEALALLGRYGEARMSGTGSAVFVCVDSEEIAGQILHNLPGDIKGFSARRVNTSPLHQILG